MDSARNVGRAWLNNQVLFDGKKYSCSWNCFKEHYTLLFKTFIYVQYDLIYVEVLLNLCQPT